MGALETIEGWDVPAAAAAVFDADSLLDEHGPVDRPFPLASVTKVLAAVTVHVAVEEGSIALDDSVGPDGSTVRHLLAHASGLAPDGTVLGPPERRRIYSNSGFEILGEHVTAATGMPFGEYARLALVEPLSLRTTDVSGSPAHGHESSVRDLCTLLRAVLRHELLAAPTVDAMTSVAFPELSGVLPGYGGQDPNPWGLGVEVRGQKDPHWTAQDNSASTWGHFGQSGTFVWFDPRASLGLVVLTDRDFGPWAVDAWPALSAAVLRDHR